MNKKKDKVKTIPIKEEKEIVYVNSTNTEFDLPFYIHRLLQDEPFLAKISRNIRKRASYDIPTAGVKLNLDDITYELIYNPKFFADLYIEPKNVKDENSLKESKKIAKELADMHRVGIIYHEYSHIFLGHCFGRKPEGVKPNIANVAMDLSINGLPNIESKLPSIALFPGKGQFKDLPKEMSMEWYLNHLPKDLKEDSFDDHSGWMDNIDDAKKEALRTIASHKLRDIIRRAVDQTERECAQGSSAWGSISEKTRIDIKSFLKPKLDPKQVLAMFIKTSYRADKVKRITKIHRRFPYIHPGSSYDRHPKIAISVDQSGSVRDEMLEKFFGWMNELSRYADFTVIPFDDQVFVDKVYVWKKNEYKPRERVLCGGTNFDSPTTYVNDLNFDGHIILTDMCAPAPLRSKCQRMWITDKVNGANPYFKTNERVLIVD